MVEKRKLPRSAKFIGIILLVPIALLSLAYLYLYATYVPSNIANFEPSAFQAKASVPFWYSIGDKLKYSDELDPQARTLMDREIKNFLVSADNTKIAVVSNGVLLIVSVQEPAVRRVVSVESIYDDSKPTGKQFFRDDDFQWSKDSKYLYLIKDEYYSAKGSQLFSIKGELWRYSLETGNLEPVLKPFPAFNYFFGLGAGIYFSVPTDHGDLQLKYFDGKGAVTDVGGLNADIQVDELSPHFIESPFFSFSISDYEGALQLHRIGNVQIDVEDAKSSEQHLKIENRPYLTVTRGSGIKGHFYCSDWSRSVFLPGNRFFLFNVPYCGNYQGQLLIDTVSESYQRLPKDSRVYIRFNTDTYTNYRISGEGISMR